MNESFYAFQFRGRTSAQHKRINYRGHVANHWSCQAVLRHAMGNILERAASRDAKRTSVMTFSSCSLILRNTSLVNEA